MRKYKLKLTLESEAIFNSGEEEQNLVNNKVLADEYGFVYFHAKTLKGQMRKRAKWLGNILADIKKKDKIEDYEKSIVKLFGSKYRGNENAENFDGKKDGNQNDEILGYNNRGIMTLSNLELSKEIRDYFKAINEVKEEDIDYKITPYDMIEAQTNKRTRIQIDNNGIAKDKMMMTYHAIKDGLEFYSEINLLEDIDIKDLTALNAIVNSLESIGSSIKRGRGKIKAELLDRNGDRVEANNLGVFFNE